MGRKSIRKVARPFFYLSRYISKLIQKNTERVGTSQIVFIFCCLNFTAQFSRDAQGLDEWNEKGMSEQTKFQFVRHDL